MSLPWRHNGRDIVSNHQPHDCLLNGLFRRRSKKISRLRVTGLCAGNSPGTGEFPAQLANNAENVSILMTSPWWCNTVKNGQWPIYVCPVEIVIFYKISLSLKSPIVSLRSIYIYLMLLLIQKLVKNHMHWRQTSAITRPHTWKQWRNDETACFIDFCNTGFSVNSFARVHIISVKMGVQ